MATARKVERFAGTGQTVDGATADLITYATATDTVVNFEVAVTMKASDGDGRQRVVAATFRNVAGTVTQIGTTSAVMNHSDADLSTAATAFVISSTSVIFRVTGVAGQTIDYFAELTARVN